MTGINAGRCKNWTSEKNLEAIIEGSVMITDWNEYMKCYNGNYRNTVSMGHWNAGSSYLGGSVKGREKLQNIKNLLSKYSLDIIGISEANI